MGSMVDPSPSLGHHAAEKFPYSPVPESYMHMGTSEITSIDETALVSIISWDLQWCFLQLYRIRALRELSTPIRSCLYP